MASMCLLATPMLHCKNPIIKPRGSNIRNRMCSPQTISMMALATTVEPIVRRSANYDPTLWSFDQIQSLSSKYKRDYYEARAETLKEVVKTMIRNEKNPLSTLELVDDLQRLGLAYNFADEISEVLEIIYNSYYKTRDQWDGMSLNLRALGFRLLRQHYYQVPQDIFFNFENETWNLKPHIHEDMVCVLNLYEASYHSFDNENIMDNVGDFATKYLKENMGKFNEGISSLVSHALEFPLHWRLPRVETKWFIQAYEKRSDKNLTLMELAKLDYDIVQASYLEDLKHASRWWKNTRWAEKLSFTRDRLVEHFLWALGFGYLPQFSLGRRTLTKINCMLTTIDDVFDLYGTLEEVERFADAVQRWDIHAINELPDYMKICFLGFYNTVNQIAYDILTDTGLLVLPYLKKAWAEQFRVFLKESRWYHTGYKPTFEEYLENASPSIGGHVLLMHTTCLLSFNSTEEITECTEKAKDILHYSSIIFRLADDLGTSSEEMARGDVPKSVQCYMYENGATEDEARRYVKSVMSDTWKKLNKARACAHSVIPREYIDCATNIPRMSQFMYAEGDGHGHPDIVKSHVLSLLFNPIQGVK